MNLKILADKDTDNRNLKTCWGLSILVNEDILFDTAEGKNTLLSNMKYLNVSIEKIKKVIISHDHYDHTGGLDGFLKENSHVEVFGLGGFSSGFKNVVKRLRATLVESPDFQKISDNIYLTGSLEAGYKGIGLAEHALVLKTENGLTIVTGCSHPGIVNIIKRVKENLPDKIYLVIGGFHLLNKDSLELRNIIEEFKILEVEKVAPTHCTGDMAILLFRQAYKDNFIDVKVGQDLNV